MKPRRRYIWLAVAAVLVIAVVVAWTIPGVRYQSRVLPHPFSRVIAYLSHVFKTDLTEHGLHSSVWGPRFLDPDTQYFTETYRYTPGERLRFQARFYQIGGEDNTFTVEALADGNTKLTVDQVVRFFLVFPKCTSSEIRILDAIEQDMKNFTEGPEQVDAATGIPMLIYPFTEMNFLRRFFSKPKSSGSTREIPPMPKGWNLTISDLMKEMKEGKRKSVGSPEADWAREYARSRIPETYRFPKKGDLYECMQDQEVTYMTSWSAPFTGGGKSILFKGERIWVDSEPNDPKPIGTYALPTEYDKLEKRMVPEEDRTNQKYGGFYFHFDTMALNEKFRLIETDYNGKGEPDDGDNVG